MHHSIAARFAARPAARFPRPSAQIRERRLGLRTSAAFRAAPALPTVLRSADLGPLAQLRAGWRAVTPARSTRHATGRLRPTPMAWTRSAGGRRQQPSAVPAPWRD
ncbi:MAG TPA: hypothetical protein VFC71_02765 [Candidatus Polarisedimenticolia bacterium]|nr:hypothetical protein [Candidatus Polarisedimenticolia bacterium]